MVRCPRQTSASAADTASWRAPGTCRPRNGIRWLPKISKCTHCSDRTAQPVPNAFNGPPLNEGENKRFPGSIEIPGVRKACPADALRYGTRDEMLALAHKRIADRLERRRPRLRREGAGRDERAVPLDGAVRETWFPTYGEKPFPAFTKTALGAVPPAVIGVGAVLGAAYAFFRKRAQKVAAAEGHGHHVEFEPLRAR